MKDLFSAQSSAYAKFRPVYPQALYDHLLSLVKEKNCAWDCGTGNGQVASVLANYFTKVYATDISEQQIENATKKSNIIYSVQPAEQTSFPVKQFDLITVAQAVHWFNFDLFYAEVKRTLKPHGLIVLIGYGLMETEESITKIIEHFYHHITGPFWDSERSYLDDGYKTIPFPFEEIRMPLFEMRYEWTLEQLRGYLGTWSAVQHYKQHHKKDPLDLIKDELSWH